MITKWEIRENILTGASKYLLLIAGTEEDAAFLQQDMGSLCVYIDKQIPPYTHSFELMGIQEEGDLEEIRIKVEGFVSQEGFNPADTIEKELDIMAETETKKESPGFDSPSLRFSGKAPGEEPLPDTEMPSQLPITFVNKHTMPHIPSVVNGKKKEETIYNLNLAEGGLEVNKDLGDIETVIELETSLDVSDGTFIDLNSEDGKPKTKPFNSFIGPLPPPSATSSIPPLNTARITVRGPSGPGTFSRTTQPFSSKDVTSSPTTQTKGLMSKIFDRFNTTRKSFERTAPPIRLSTRTDSQNLKAQGTGPGKMAPMPSTFVQPPKGPAPVSHEPPPQVMPTEIYFGGAHTEYGNRLSGIIKSIRPGGPAEQGKNVHSVNVPAKADLPKPQIPKLQPQVPQQSAVPPQGGQIRPPLSHLRPPQDVPAATAYSYPTEHKKEVPASPVNSLREQTTMQNVKPVSVKPFESPLPPVRNVERGFVVEGETSAIKGIEGNSVKLGQSILVDNAFETSSNFGVAMPIEDIFAAQTIVDFDAFQVESAANGGPALSGNLFYKDAAGKDSFPAAPVQDKAQESHAEVKHVDPIFDHSPLAKERKEDAPAHPPVPIEETISFLKNEEQAQPAIIHSLTEQEDDSFAKTLKPATQQGEENKNIFPQAKGPAAAPIVQKGSAAQDVFKQPKAAAMQNAPAPQNISKPALIKPQPPKKKAPSALTRMAQGFYNPPASPGAGQAAQGPYPPIVSVRPAPPRFPVGYMPPGPALYGAQRQNFPSQMPRLPAVPKQFGEITREFMKQKNSAEIGRPAKARGDFGPPPPPPNISKDASAHDPFAEILGAPDTEITLNTAVGQPLVSERTFITSRKNINFEEPLSYKGALGGGHQKYYAGAKRKSSAQEGYGGEEEESFKNHRDKPNGSKK